MSKTWMPLYIDDYLADTKHLTPTQHGCYLLLIMHYWQHGYLPTDEAALARIVGATTGPRWRSTCLALASFFEQPGWRHKRIDKELERAAAISEKRQVSGRIGGLRKHYKGPMPRVISEANAKQTGYHKKERKIEREPNPPEEAIPTSASPSGPTPELEQLLKAKGWVP